jgi:hypothetical protein
MPGSFFLHGAYSITLLLELPELLVLQVPVQPRQVPEQVLVQVLVQAPQPSGVLPASALLPSCSQPLQRKTSRRKAGIE